MAAQNKTIKSSELIILAVLICLELSQICTGSHRYHAKAFHPKVALHSGSYYYPPWREQCQQCMWDSWPEHSPFGPQFAMQQESTGYNL